MLCFETEICDFIHLSFFISIFNLCLAIVGCLVCCVRVGSWLVSVGVVVGVIVVSVVVLY